MKLSIFKKDWLIVDEENQLELKETEKVHLIKLDFEDPTIEKVEKVFDRFPSTNRYIISNNIRFYNNILKARKKYYVENTKNSGLISFFKRNNKVLLNIDNLIPSEFNFVKSCFDDILKNVEVILISDVKSLEESWAMGIQYWNGNVLVR